MGAEPTPPVLPGHRLLRAYFLAEQLRVRSDGWLGRVVHWARVYPDTIDVLLEIGSTWPELVGVAAEALFRGVGDGHLQGDRFGRAEAALTMLETCALPTDDLALAWRLTLRIVLGRAAMADWQRLAKLPEPVILSQLWIVVRAWIPLQESGTLSAGAMVGELRSLIHGLRCAQPENANVVHLEVFTDICFGGSTAAHPPAELAGRFSRKERAFLAIVGWLAGAEDWAASLVESLATIESQADHAERFYHATACVLLLPAGAAQHLRTEIEQADERLFAPTVPSHIRCFLQALNWAALGDRDAAGHWRRRAIEVESTAAVRTAAWKRACAKSGISAEV
jgi:hypothetical protein